MIHAQKPAWIVGDRLMRFPGYHPDTLSLAPLPQASGGYQGAIATRSQYVQLDDQGALLFFVIDGAVYDREGYLIADNDGDPVNCTECLLQGTTEVLVHPVPGRCGQWYLFSTDVAQGTLDYALTVAVLDMTAQNPHHPSDPQRRGRVLDTDGLTTAGFDLLTVWSPWIAGDHAVALNNLQNPVQIPNEVSGQPRALHMDITACDAQARTFLLVNSGEHIAKYELLADQVAHLGTHAYSTIAPNADVFHNHPKGEVEAICVDSEVRFALTYHYTQPGNQFTPSLMNLAVKVMRFNPQTPALNWLTHDEFVVHQYSPPMPHGATNVLGDTLHRYKVAGLEFSPNGRHLYWFKAAATTPDSAAPVMLGRIDLDLDTILPVRSGIPWFVDGELEVNRSPDGQDMALWMAGTDDQGVVRFGVLIGPDDPGTATWVDSVFTAPALTWCQNNYLGGDRFALLMAQAHGDTSDAPGFYAACCPELLAMTGQHAYTAPTGTWSWSPGNNPFQNRPVVRVASDLIIPAGAHITATGLEFHFGPDANLVIKPGGSFTANGCTLRDACGERWPGIRVEGNALQDQQGVPHPTHQGKLVLQGSTVWNAHTGVLVGKVLGGIPFLSLSGGVVKATDATFRNCRTGVRFHRYTPVQNGQAVFDRSSFLRCTFTVDSAYLEPYDFSSHAYLWGITGIPFTQCLLENTLPDAHPYIGQESHRLGHGIHSLDAHYRVRHGCATALQPGQECPPQYIQPSVFRGLDHGIHARSGTDPRKFSAVHTRFEGNICGVFANAVPGYVVQQCHFALGARDVQLTGDIDEQFRNYHRGIYSYESWGFRVDDNTLQQDGPYTQTEGIVIGYSRDHNDVVFRNQASGLERAYIGEGVCADPANRTHVGLQYYCNTNDGNATNFWSRAVPDDPINPENEHTMRTTQGSNLRPAGNTFDRVAPTPADGDFKSTCIYNVLNYRYNAQVAPEEPIGLTQNYVTKQEVLYPPADYCLSRLLVVLDGGPGRRDVSVTQLMDHLDQHKSGYTDTRYLYDELMDGGDHDALVQQIQGSWSGQAWELHAYLMGMSPFLSTEALQSMVLENVLPPALVAEVLVANPEATQQEGFVAWLQEESGYPLPSYLVDLVIASWGEEPTYRGELENLMAYHHGEMSLAGNLLLQLWEQDTTAYPADSLLWAWQQLHSPAARYAEALGLVGQHAFGSATSLVLDLDKIHVLNNENTMAERERMLDLIAFWESVHNDDRSAAELDSAEVATLQGLIHEAYDRPAQWIANVLCFFYGHCRPPLTGGDEEQRRPQRVAPTNSQSPLASLRIYPNPATTWVTLLVDLPGQPAEATLTLHDVAGRVVRHSTLKPGQQQQLWDTRGVPPGSYTVVLRATGLQPRSEKLILQP